MSKPLFHRPPVICTSIVFRDRDIVTWQSLLFSQLITNNLWSRCGINHLRYFVTLRMQPFLLAPHCRGRRFAKCSAFAGYYFVYPHTISVIRYKFQRAPIEGGRPPGRQESPSQAHIGVQNRPHHGFGRGNPSDNSCCFLQLIGFPDLKACQFCAYATRGSAFSYDKRCGLGERIHWFQKYLRWYGQGPRVRSIGHSGIIRISRN